MNGKEGWDAAKTVIVLVLGRIGGSRDLHVPQDVQFGWSYAHTTYYFLDTL